MYVTKKEIMATFAHIPTILLQPTKQHVPVVFRFGIQLQ